MARLPRLTLAGHAHHLLQRGNNRQAIFIDDEDRERMLALLLEASRAHRVAIHAYVLMDNHFHLIATPETDDGLAQMMQAVGRSYVRSFNRRHERSGTLFEGRFRSTVIEAEQYLLSCMVFLDANPVRHGVVADAQDYRWSSHAHCIGQHTDRLLTPHALYWALGNTPFARELAYQQLVRDGLGGQQLRQLSEALEAGWPLGRETFVQNLQRHTPRRLVKTKAGRPPKLIDESPSEAGR